MSGRRDQGQHQGLRLRRSTNLHPRGQSEEMDRKWPKAAPPGVGEGKIQEGHNMIGKEPRETAKQMHPGFVRENAKQPSRSAMEEVNADGGEESKASEEMRGVRQMNGKRNARDPPGAGQESWANIALKGRFSQERDAEAAGRSESDNNDGRKSWITLREDWTREGRMGNPRWLWNLMMCR